MRELNICPSTLQEGFSTYSPTALKQLFDGQPVSHILDFDSPNNESADNEAYVKNVGRISLSTMMPISRTFRLFIEVMVSITWLLHTT